MERGLTGAALRVRLRASPMSVPNEARTSVAAIR